MRKDPLGSVNEYGINNKSFDGRELVEPLEVGYVTDQSKASGTDITDSVGAYTTATTWAAGDTDILSGAHYSWKIFAKVSQ
jgi:hypothetical protein